MSNLPDKRDYTDVEVYPAGGRYRPYIESEKEIELRDYYKIMAKRKWLVLAVLFSVVACTALQTFTVTPTFRSTVQIRIDPESSNVLPYEDLMDSPISYWATESYMQTNYRILESRALAQRVIDKLDLTNNLTFSKSGSGGVLLQSLSMLKSLVMTFFSPEVGTKAQQPRDVERFLRRLEVNPIAQSRLVEISYDSQDPEFSAAVVNTLAEEYIEQNFETRYQATVKATEFLQKEMEELKIRVEKSEEELTRYDREHGILNIDERENIVQQRLADLNQELTRVQAELIARTARFEAVRDATLEDFPQSLKTDLIIDLENRLFSLDQDLARLSADFGPEWPEVVSLKREILAVEGQLDRERQRSMQHAKVTHAVALHNFSMISKAMDDQKRIANQLNEDSIQHNILSREVESNKQLYEGLLQRLKEAGVSAGLKSSNIQIVDRGEVPWEIHRPRSALNLALGLMVGLMSGVGLAFLVEYMDNTLKTPEQVEEFFGFPALGVIPIISPSEERANRLLPAGEGSGAQTATGSRIGEAYRSLRTALLLSSSGRQPKSVLVTSSFTGEGKTTTAMNLGLVCAQTGARTLLIDLDMRKPMLGRRFGINGGGMSTFLSGNSDLSSQIQHTSVPGLFLLPAGPIPPNPAELIGADRMQEALKLLGDHFKHIVIDSPPILSVTDALVLSPVVDGVVMVIHGGKTARDVVGKATSHLEHVGAKILGAVINNVDIESSEYYYYYRHYYDYGYYSEDKRA